jgi:hypothetical protein
MNNPCHVPRGVQLVRGHYNTFEELNGNYRFAGVDLAKGPDHSIVGHIIFERIELPSFAFVMRHSQLLMEEVLGLDVVPKYPDVEQMLLDCAQVNR